MEPIAYVTAALAALYVVIGVARTVAPTATVAFERRVVYPTPARLRLLGVLVLVGMAGPIIATARAARADLGEVSLWIEGFGWYAAVASVWVIVTPGLGLRLVDWFWDAYADPGPRRAVGLLTLAFGLFFGWVAFSVQ